MRQLPPAIASWAQPLAAVAPDLQPTLLSWLRRVDAALGSLGAGRAHADGEPDGYDGLTQRGPYHRLLASQWLLADALPDEFLRRAVMGEHTFFRTAHSRPEGEPAVVVLIDAGPDQLGAPRIGQLAALVVLARRAAHADAKLLWGHLHGEPDLHEGLDGRAVRQWMMGRTRLRTDESQAQRWRSRLDASMQRTTRWVLGPARLADLAALDGFHHVAFESPLFSESQSVQLLTRAAGSRAWSRPTVLPLPEQANAVRLLRDPFQDTPSKVQTAGAIEITGDVDVSDDGRTVSVRLAAGGVISYPIPNSPNAQVGRPRHIRPDSSYAILAATRSARRLLALALRGNTLYFFGVGTEQGKTGHVQLRRLLEPEELAALGLGGGEPQSTTLRRLIPYRTGQGVGMLMHAPSGRVLSLVPRGKGFDLQINPFALAIAPAKSGHGYLRAHRASEERVELVDTVHGVQASLAVPRDWSGRLYLGGGTLAAEQKPGIFRLAVRGQVELLHAPTGVEVVGALDGGLLCLEEGRTRLSLLRRSSAKVLANTRGRVVQVKVGYWKSLVALTTDVGEVLVVTPSRDLPLLHIRTKGPP